MIWGWPERRKTRVAITHRITFHCLMLEEIEQTKVTKTAKLKLATFGIGRQHWLAIVAPDAISE